MVGDGGDGQVQRALREHRFFVPPPILLGWLLVAALTWVVVLVLSYAWRFRQERQDQLLETNRLRAELAERARTLIGVGLAVGTGVALYASRFAKSFLFQLEPNDPRVFAAALGVLALAGLAASLVPARRVASVDPIVALRRE
jgi:uncharacterized protein (TIGR04206 family)